MVISHLASDDIRSKYQGVVVAFVGPPHSGKTVLYNAVQKFLLAWKVRFFQQRACPDGEGNWSQETDPLVVAQIRRKCQFDQRFLTAILPAIENLGKFFPLVLVDCGGRRSAENAEILARCTHFILISRLAEEIEPWVRFCQDEGVTPAAVLTSSQVKTTEGELDSNARSMVDVTPLPVKGELVNLDRVGPVDPYADAVEQLTRVLVELSDQQIKSGC